MAEEPGSIPPIQLRESSSQEDREEEERKRGAALLPRGAGSGGTGVAGNGAGAAGRLGAAGAAESGAAAESASLASRLLSPLRSTVEFLRKAASLGLIDGTKFALRNVVVQGLLAGLVVAVIAGIFITPDSEKSGKPGTGGVFASNSGGVAPEEVRGNGLYGAIPGIYEKVMAKLRGAPSPEPPSDSAEAPKTDGAAEGKKAEEGVAVADAEELAKAKEAAGSASPLMRAKLERLSSLFGSGGGGGGGGGGSAANLAVGGKAGAGGGAADGKRAASVGKLEGMKRGRVKVPLRQGTRQGALNAKDARGQLKNAQLASQIAGKASDGQAGASMASLPFDGARVPGGSVAETPGGGIGPWVPGGTNLNNTPGPSELPEPGGPTPKPEPKPDPNPSPNPCGKGMTIGKEGKCIPDPCPDGEMTDPAGKCIKLSNVSPYQADLDQAARLIGQGQQAIDGAGKFKWLAILCFAIAGLIVWNPFASKAKKDSGDQVLTASQNQQIANAAMVRDAEIEVAKGLPDAAQSKLALAKAAETYGGKYDAIIKGGMTGVGTATKAADSGGWIARIGAAVAIAGIGMAFLNQYTSKMQEGQEALAQAQELADNVKETYNQTDQAGRITSATDTKCTADGKPKVQNPAACGYKQDMTSNELRDYVKCMTAPVCTPKNP